MNDARVFPEGGCFWCGVSSVARTMTRDHLIPIWACRALPDLRTQYDTIEGPHRVVKSCSACNTLKDGMPPERFYHLRHDRRACRQEAAKWKMVARNIVSCPLIAPSVRTMVVEAMLRPIPGYSPPPTPWTSPPNSKNPPLKRIYNIADFGPAADEAGHPAGTKG